MSRIAWQVLGCAATLLLLSNCTNPQNLPDKIEAIRKDMATHPAATLKKFQDLNEDFPGDPALLYAIAETYLLLPGNNDLSAAVNFELAAYKSQGDKKAWYRAARLFSKVGDVSSQLENLCQHLQHYPDEDAWLDLGQILIQSKKQAHLEVAQQILFGVDADRPSPRELASLRAELQQDNLLTELSKSGRMASGLLAVETIRLLVPEELPTLPSVEPSPTAPAPPPPPATSPPAPPPVQATGASTRTAAALANLAPLPLLPSLPVVSSHPEPTEEEPVPIIAATDVEPPPTPTPPPPAATPPETPPQVEESAEEPSEPVEPTPAPVEPSEPVDPPEEPPAAPPVQPEPPAPPEESQNPEPIENPPTEPGPAVVEPTRPTEVAGNEPGATPTQPTELDPPAPSNIHTPAQDPSSTDVHEDPVQLGNQAFEAKDYEKAGEHFWQAVRSNPENPILWYNLSHSFYRQDQFKKAEMMALEAARRDPRNPEYVVHFLKIKRSQEDPESYHAELKRARKLFPDDPFVIYELAISYANVDEDYRAAAILFNEFLEKHPDHPHAESAKEALDKLQP